MKKVLLKKAITVTIILYFLCVITVHYWSFQQAYAQAKFIKSLEGEACSEQPLRNLVIDLSPKPAKKCTYSSEQLNEKLHELNFHMLATTFGVWLASFATLLAFHKLRKWRVE